MENFFSYLSSLQVFYNPHASLGLGIHSVCPGADRQCACAGGASPDNLRRYEIAEVRRKARNLPRGYLQADLDIVHPPGLPPPDKMLAEAELIKVTSAPHPCYAVLGCDAHCHLGSAVLCCAVLCCAVLCCAVLCCAVLCCAVLCCVVSSAVPSMDHFMMITLLPAP